jgi:hypothetical protein
MNGPVEIENYNYSEFVGSDFLQFRTHLPVGSAAPDFQATLLETERPVRLSDYWNQTWILLAACAQSRISEREPRRAGQQPTPILRFGIKSSPSFVMFRAFAVGLIFC